jgi:hypothetical protein
MEIQITCAARRLTMNGSSKAESFGHSLPLPESMGVIA